MLTEPLPTTLDVRKAAAREVTVSGTVALEKLPRLQTLLASDEGHIEAECRFERDEENRFIAEVNIRAELYVRCQRCLERLALQLESSNRLAIVSDDELARQLPASLDPWVVDSETGDLWALVEDDLILEVPAVAYHDTEACRRLLDDYRQPPSDIERDGDNPFKVLERLKTGSTEQEN